MTDFLIDKFLPILISAFLGGGGAVAFIKRYSSPVKEVLELVAVVLESVEDGKITATEVRKIIDEADDIPAALSAISNKAPVARDRAGIELQDL
jgi:hypothetical protein